jgi:membrane protein implicated in regulation of membrane protease activity
MSPHSFAWVLSLLIVAAAAYFIFRMRGGENLACSQCGHDLSQHESDGCPECGAVVAKPIGAVGRVMSEIRGTTTGEVKVNGRKWKAGQAAPMMPLTKGTKVRVVASRGMILLVGPTKTGPGGWVKLG